MRFPAKSLDQTWSGFIKTYSNRWVSGEVLDLLSREKGAILDVGGGAAPYWRAEHVLDVQPYDGVRLAQNAWGIPIEEKAREWRSSQYTRFDLCSRGQWPFRDDRFDLGLCSHCVEDLRDPVPVIEELGRVCKTVVLIAPSRLLEQTMGIDHPRYCGFYHHLWMVTAEGNTIVFRRKTPNTVLRGCHFRCPPFRMLKREAGCFWFRGTRPKAVERMFWDAEKDCAEYRAYISEMASKPGLLEWDRRQFLPGYWIYRARQRFMGEA